MPCFVFFAPQNRDEQSNPNTYVDSCIYISHERSKQTSETYNITTEIPIGGLTNSTNPENGSTGLDPEELSRYHSTVVT